MFSKSISARLIENLDKSAEVQVSAVFETHEYVDSGRVF